jgi:hypothetical protein
VLHNYLEHRPSSLGIDHGWCVYSKPVEPCRLWPPLLKQPKLQFLCSDTKKHANSVHIISPVFTSFLRRSHRFSPPWTIRALLKGYTQHTQARWDIQLCPYMRHIIAENGTSSSPNIVDLCYSKTGADKFFVSSSATILLVLHCTSFTMQSLTSWSTKAHEYLCVATPFGYLGSTWTF